VDVSILSKFSRIVETNFNWETFNMFNSIETSGVTRGMGELLPYSGTSLQRKLVAAIFGRKLFG